MSEQNAKLNINNIWIPVIAAVLAATITGAFGFYFKYLETSERIKHEILSERKKALFDALTVIDLVYANSEFDGKTPLARKQWDIQLARDAYNKMLIYCSNPERTIKAFHNAIGLYNHGLEKPRGFSAASINEFRREVARELELSDSLYLDPNRAWIGVLPGTKEEMELRKRRIKEAHVK